MKGAVVALVLAIFAIQQPRDAVGGRSAPSGASMISGVVTMDDAGGTPVRLATVTLTGGTLALGRTVVTGDDGAFVFDNLPAGRYSISAKKPAYVTTFFGAKRPGSLGTEISLTAGQRFSGVSLKMARGAVITGTILDATGAPARDLQVTAVRVGDPGLDPPSGPFSPTPATDDRGAYRIFGLSPGEYIVAAVPGAAPGTSDMSMRSTADLDAVLQQLQARSRLVVQPARTPAPERPLPPVTYGSVPVFFPGTTRSAEAQRLRLGAGEERPGVDFALRLVRAAAVAGVIAGAGATMPGISMSITGMDQPVRLSGPLVGTSPRLSHPPDDQGRFMYESVPPGRYLITARVTGAAPSRGNSAGVSGFGSPGSAATSWAMADIVVDGANVEGVTLTLQPAMRLTGRVVFDPPGEVDPASARVILQRVDINFSSNINGTSMGGISPPPGVVRPDGTFEVGGVLPATYRLTTILPRAAGWSLRSAIVNGRDVLDFPLEFGGAGDVGGAVLTFSNRHTEIAGTFASTSGAAADYVIVAFPADRALWRPGSRRVKAIRPATDGEFVIADLAAGDYLIAALTDLEPGDTDRPTFLEALVSSSLPISIADGEKKRQDVRVR